MIKITIFKNDRNDYVGFKANNHAEFSEAGTDIVCAAVSMLVMNTMNAIEAFTEISFESNVNEEECTITFELKESPTSSVQLLLDTMILGLQSIEDNEEEGISNAVDIIFEEV